MANVTAKKPEERRRPAAPKRGEWTDLPEELDKPVIPALPARTPDGDPWPQWTRDVWNAWREDPVTTQWSKSDVTYALETMAIHARSPYTNASELRLRFDALGMTPKGKRDLRYRTAAYVQAIEQTERRTAQRKTRGKRRATLSAVA